MTLCLNLIDFHQASFPSTTHFPCFHLIHPRGVKHRSQFLFSGLGGVGGEKNPHLLKNKLINYSLYIRGLKLKIHNCIIPLPGWGQGRACYFPKEWHGSWFQEGHLRPVEINSTAIATKGHCVLQSDDKFILHDRLVFFFSSLQQVGFLSSMTHQLILSSSFHVRSGTPVRLFFFLGGNRSYLW